MHDSNLDRRVADLEETVRRLEAQVASLTPRRGPAPPRARRAASAPRNSPQIPEQLKDARYWFRILGIGLLLLGTAFIFKYAEDEGRNIMMLRVAIGAAMGLVLTTIGFRLRHSEPHFASVLSGGGIGVWYITGFAAFQIFDLISAPAAFTFMTIVTGLAFFLALRQGVVALSVVGALGGLGTPWLLYETDRALLGPVVYMCLVLAGSIAVYAKKGWKALLWSAALMGGGAFVAIGARYYVDEGLPDERMTMQAGFAFYWVLFACAAAIREFRARILPAAVAPLPETSPATGSRPGSIGDTEIFVTLIAIYGVGMTTATWEPNLRVGGWVALGTAAAYASVWRWLTARPGLASLAQAHLLSALILVTTGVAVLLEGEVLVSTLAAEAAAIHLISKRVGGRLLPLWGHLVFFVIGLITFVRLVADGQSGTPILNSAAMTHLWVIVAGTAASFAMRTRGQCLAYRYAAHALILIWVLRELHELPNGQGLVSIIWGVYAIALVVAGLKTQSTKLRVLGLVTLVITVLKLVAIDLGDVKAIWRVLLFLGFGAVLLFLSHWSQRFGNTTTGPITGDGEAGNGD